MRKSFPLILTIFGATGSAVSLVLYKYFSSLEPVCRTYSKDECFEEYGKEAARCGIGVALGCEGPETLIYKVLVVGFIIITVVGLALLIRQRIRK